MRLKIMIVISTGKLYETNFWVLEVIWVTEDITEEAWKIFEQYNKDKQWSFTDCTSYSVIHLG
jgi:predicted nucleic acid-binding protein